MSYYDKYMQAQTEEELLADAKTDAVFFWDDQTQLAKIEDAANRALITKGWAKKEE